MIGELKFGKCALGRDEKPIGHNIVTKRQLSVLSKTEQY